MIPTMSMGITIIIVVSIHGRHAEQKILPKTNKKVVLDKGMTGVEYSYIERTLYATDL